MMEYNKQVLLKEDKEILRERSDMERIIEIVEESLNYNSGIRKNGGKNTFAEIAKRWEGTARADCGPRILP